MGQNFDDHSGFHPKTTPEQRYTQSEANDNVTSEIILSNHRKRQLNIAWYFQFHFIFKKNMETKKMR